ncbi:MAG: DUF1961 family protein [Propionibacteriaceae bacterium]|nr:DUF1961 family protein [Propionibacteriaceae bacterium]
MANYRNPLRTLTDLDGWVAEGPHSAEATPQGLVFSSGGDDTAHWVLWCPEVFGDRIRITWEFSPRSEPGLAMLFLGASSVAGGSIFDEGLRNRAGVYAHYHSSDIRTLHASYFRRRFPDERAFHLANLRKSPGAHLVAQGADPLPSVEDSEGFYRVEVVQDADNVSMSINGLLLFSWYDDGSTGPRVGSGRIGFRQMSPLVACYRNLEVADL